MGRTTSFIGLFFFLLFWMESPLMAQVGGMHRQRGVEKDPLLFTFSQVAEAVEKGGEEGWKEARLRLDELSPTLKRYAEQFGIDVVPRLETAIGTKKGGDVLKFLAQVIFLGMKEEFIKAGEEITNFVKSKGHLSTARSYYDRVLSGNVKRRDILVHAKIVDEFDSALKAVEGGADFLHPDPQKFAAASKKIEGHLVEIYTYFKE